jgi:hypothetical protein
MAAAAAEWRRLGGLQGSRRRAARREPSFELDPELRAAGSIMTIAMMRAHLGHVA